MSENKGGYPELQEQDKEWGAFYADYVKTYMERDVRELAAVQDLNAFIRNISPASLACCSIKGSSRDTYFLSGKTFFSRVDFPTWRAPVFADRVCKAEEEKREICFRASGRAAGAGYLK